MYLDVNNLYGEAISDHYFDVFEAMSDYYFDVFGC